MTLVRNAFAGPIAALIGLMACVASAGCESGSPRAQDPSAARASMTAAALPSRPALDAAGRELRQTFAEWIAARAAGDTVAFEALYDVRRFVGVRWTQSGVEKRMTWAEWNAEQRSWLGPGHAALPDRAVFESWPGGTLDAATASVAFNDRGPSGGHRVLVFGRADGKLRIVREELGGSLAHVTSARLDTLSRDAKVLRALGQPEDK